MTLTGGKPMTWQEAWTNGFMPNLSNASLEALLAALEEDDVRLMQGQTTSPPPLMCVRYWPVEGACAVAFAGWQGEGCDMVGEAEEFFAKKCFEADMLLGEPAACRCFLDAFDNKPRPDIFRELAAVIREGLKQREELCVA